MEPLTPKPKEVAPEEAQAVYDACWQALQSCTVAELKRLRPDLITWRRGSAQMVLKINPGLDNLTVYSVLVAGVPPSTELYRYLLAYNVLQRRECLGLAERDGKLYVVLKYTMELAVATMPVLQRHVYALQEVADKTDTELRDRFGGSLAFDDWETLDQEGVDSLLANLFG